MEHFPCALHGNGDGSPQELQDAQLLPPNSAEYQAWKTFVFKSILVGARANLLWDQDISGSYYGANIQHHVDTDRTRFILEMTQIWSIESSSCLTAISKLGESSRTGSSCLISKSIWMCVFPICYFVCYMLVFRDRKRSLKKTQHKNCHFADTAPYGAWYMQLHVHGFPLPMTDPWCCYIW